MKYLIDFKKNLLKNGGINDKIFHQMYHGFHQVYHQMRQVCQVFHQVSIVVTSVVFTHDSELRLKNLI